MRWLGTLLGRRESIMLQKLDAVPNVPSYVGPVTVDGVRLNNAVAHDYIEGEPFRHREQVTDEFLDELTQLIAVVHQHGIAYIDLHKRENILEGSDGKPHLIDFQVGFWRPESRIGAFFSNWLLAIFQNSDRYHLLKHVARCRPEMESELDRKRPLVIRLHRCIGVPLRTLRRRLLVLAGVRAGNGSVTTEAQPEIGHQNGG